VVRCAPTTMLVSLEVRWYFTCAAQPAPSSEHIQIPNIGGVRCRRLGSAGVAGCSEEALEGIGVSGKEREALPARLSPGQPMDRENVSLI
jgi:hypothetical protein